MFFKLFFFQIMFFQIAHTHTRHTHNHFLMQVNMYMCQRLDTKLHSLQGFPELSTVKLNVGYGGDDTEAGR